MPTYARKLSPRVHRRLAVKSIQRARLSRWQRLGEKVHFLPFDDGDVPDGKTVVAEGDPPIFRNGYRGRTFTCWINGTFTAHLDQHTCCYLFQPFFYKLPVDMLGELKSSSLHSFHPWRVDVHNVTKSVIRKFAHAIGFGC